MHIHLLPIFNISTEGKKLVEKLVSFYMKRNGLYTIITMYEKIIFICTYIS